MHTVYVLHTVGRGTAVGLAVSVLALEQRPAAHHTNGERCCVRRRRRSSFLWRGATPQVHRLGCLRWLWSLPRRRT